MAAEIVISPENLNERYWGDLFRFRHAFFSLARREFLLRYRQAVFGAAWAFVRPIVLALSLTLALRGIGAAAGSGAQYFLTTYLSILLWQLFSSGVSDATNSLVNQRFLVTQLYIPRIYLPSASIFVNLVDLLIGGGTFIVLAAISGSGVPGPALLAVPLLLQLLVLTLATGWLFAAVNVKFRDVRHFSPFFLQMLFFLSPILYSLPLPSTTASVLLLFNPLVGIFEGMKYALLGARHPLLPAAISISVIETISIAAVSLLFFRRLERTFSDVI